MPQKVVNLKNVLKFWTFNTFQASDLRNESHEVGANDKNIDVFSEWSHHFSVFVIIRSKESLNCVNMWPYLSEKENNYIKYENNCKEKTKI